MLEILVLLIAMILMAKKNPRRRAMGRYIRGNINEDVSLGTLAANTGVLESTPAVSERTLVSSIVNRYTLSGMTAGDNIGPIMVGVAHGDYTLAEVEEWIELGSSWAEANLITRETSDRKIRRIGVFDTPATAGQSYTLNDGKAIKTKLNWILNAGQGLNFFFYNLGSSPLATTDPNVQVEGHANLWPR